MLSKQSSQTASKDHSFVTQSSAKVSIDLIQLSLKQPRRYFDPKKLEQLIESIKQHGILEPVLVRPLDNGKYELVAGERRIRAAR
ncbi:MAG: ParB/RepB/Spo0J family partition protein, partial [Trichormus sp.]